MLLTSIGGRHLFFRRKTILVIHYYYKKGHYSLIIIPHPDPLTKLAHSFARESCTGKYNFKRGGSRSVFHCAKSKIYFHRSIFCKHLESLKQYLALVSADIVFIYLFIYLFIQKMFIEKHVELSMNYWNNRWYPKIFSCILQD